MGQFEIKQTVKRIASTEGILAAREWIFRNLHPGEQQAAALAALCSLVRY